MTLPGAFKREGCVPLLIGGKRVGIIAPHVLEEIEKHPEMFAVVDILPTESNYKKFLVGVILLFISSPEHEVLMVSYCGQWLSVVVRRPSCVNI